MFITKFKVLAISLFSLSVLLRPLMSIAQCDIDCVEPGDFALSCQGTCQGSQSTIQISWDYEAANETGGYGLQLEIFLQDGVSGISNVSGSTTNSWLFGNASASVNVSYNATLHSILVSAVRLDCKGKEGTGLVFTVTFTHSACGYGVISSVGGCIVMVDNIDLG